METAGDDLPFPIPCILAASLPGFSDIQPVASQRAKSMSPFLAPKVFMSLSFHGLRFMKDGISCPCTFLTEILPDGLLQCQNDFLNYFSPSSTSLLAGPRSPAFLPKDFSILKAN